MKCSQQHGDESSLKQQLLNVWTASVTRAGSIIAASKESILLFQGCAHWICCPHSASVGIWVPSQSKFQSRELSFLLCLWERTGGIRLLSEGKASSKPVGIWYYEAAQKIGKLDIFRKRRIPKLVFQVRVKMIKNCAYSDRFILMPNMPNLDLTIKVFLFFLSLSLHVLPIWDSKLFLFSQILLLCSCSPSTHP